MDPILLPANQPLARFYTGGSRIAQFRGESSSIPNTPEDWVASTTSVRGHDGVGQTRLPSGELLAEAIAGSPLDWLGAEHIVAFGADTKLLVKLLDAGQRLPVHAHPSREAAARLVAATHGKAEGWYVLTAGEVYLGLRREVSEDELLRIVRLQDTESLLALMHRVDVAAHDTVYVPPGVLHAIGSGVFLVELQEPEDLSILIEWKGFDLDGADDGHLGVGFEAALTAVELRARSSAEIAELVRHDGGSFPNEAAQYFRLEAISIGPVAVQGFAVLVVAEGNWHLERDGRDPVTLAAGTTVALPFAAGPGALVGEGLVLVARPPSATAAE
jgi:mannose-6-phosphate isomerase